MAYRTEQHNSPSLSVACPAKTPLLSVIIPLFNERDNLSSCQRRVLAALDKLESPSELVYVDDGSSDDSWETLQQLRQYPGVHHIQCLRLSRNFGKEAAMCAGLAAARGQAVVLLDADLQDPPEWLPKMVERWREGFDIVDMKRAERRGESWFKRTTASGFYRLLNRLSDLEIPENVGDFRLLDRRVVEHINQLPERTRFMKGLFAWPGFRRTTLVFDRAPRAAGETKWRYGKLLQLAIEGITSFSTKPLRIAGLAGVAASLLALLMMLSIVVKTLLFGEVVAGYPTLISVVLLLGGIQLLAIGVMGEYLGRIFIESKQRPLYLVMEHLGESSQPQGASR